MSELISREIRLKSRPVGLPGPENFELAQVSIPDPGPGQVQVRNLYMSVDPYMRGRMRAGASYAANFELGEALTGGCVGRVDASRHPDFQPGDYVLGFQGWREAYLSDGRDLEIIDPGIAPIQSYLGVMGMPGQTAYFGLLDIGKPQPGETVFVSAAAGAVSGIVCQIAKIQGCRVVGSAGSAQKVQWLLAEAGVDAAFNYKEIDHLTKELARHAPDGIDVYFENVGGDHLQAALTLMNNNGRIPVCGMISGYNADRPVPGPTNLANIIGKRLLLQGFIVSDYRARAAEFYRDMGGWVQAGQIKWRETIVDGIEKAPEAFMGLFQGENLGKMLVKLGD